MKRFICLNLLLLLLRPSHAFAAVLSSTNNGVYIAIGGMSSNECLRYDERIVWHAFCTNGSVDLNYPAPAFGTKIRMTGPDGREVAKTDLGNSFGTKFEKVRRFEDTASQGQIGYHAQHTGVMIASGAYDPREGLLSGPVLPSPQQLFKMGAPGTYKMEIQMQMFLVNRDTNWTRKLLLFEPVKLSVVKPPD